MEVLKPIIALFCLIWATPLIFVCSVIGFLAFMAYTGFSLGWNFVKVQTYRS